MLNKYINFTIVSNLVIMWATWGEVENAVIEVKYMVKVITMLKRRDGLALEEFLRYWQEKHGPLLLKLVPGLKRYVQNTPVRLPRSGELQFDGIAELWFDDLESWRRATDFYLGDEGKPIRDDEEKFLDKSKLAFFVAEEKLITD